jgi:hypothetical protein
VNGGKTVEVVAAAKDNKGQEFLYETLEEARQLRYEMNVSNGMPEKEAKADANKFQFSKDRAQTKYGGTTLPPVEAGNKNWRVIIPDGTGQTSRASQAEFASWTAHELYGHALPGSQGKPYKHEYTDPPGPVGAHIKQIEERTMRLYQPPKQKER